MRGYVFYVWRLWEAHLYVFYVSGRLLGGPHSYHPEIPGGSARKDLTRAGGGEGVWGSGAAHLYVFYVSWRLWEAHLYVFYVSGGGLGGSNL